MARDKVNRTMIRRHVVMARQDGTLTGTAPGGATSPPVPGRLADRRAIGPPAVDGDQAPPYEPPIPGARGRRGADGAAGLTGRPGRSASPVPEFDEPYVEPQFPARRGPPGGAGATGPAGARGRVGQPAIEFEELAIEPNLPGRRGASGVAGSQGDKGGLRYNFDTSTVSSDPGVGRFRYDNATIALVSSIFIDDQEFNGTDVSAYIDTWDDTVGGGPTVAGYIIVKSNTNGDATVNIFGVQGTVLPSGGYRQVFVSYVSGALPANGEACTIEFIRSGNGGTAGTNGAPGTNGARGPRGFALPALEFEEPLVELPIPGRRGRAGAAGAAAMTDITKDLGVARSSGTFDITGLAGLTVDKVVTIVQTAAAIASKGNARDEPEFDHIQLTGYVLDAATIRAYWWAPSTVVGSYAFAYAVNG